MIFTGGKVSFGRVVRPADYESKSASVEVTFAVEPDDDFDAALNEAAKKAQAKALELVGLKLKQ